MLVAGLGSYGYAFTLLRSLVLLGAGLGLAICHNIVEAHGGKITASAAPLGGLLISIRLPRPRILQG